MNKILKLTITTLLFLGFAGSVSASSINSRSHTYKDTSTDIITYFINLLTGTKEQTQKETTQQNQPTPQTNPCKEQPTQSTKNTQVNGYKVCDGTQERASGISHQRIPADPLDNNKDKKNTQ